ncbi:hypothetical protein SAMD00019534_116770, partial [Acytostelium subglobosum LB1]|uniref:hypothetical protein n=1 Tax=Acytostelium subglobosum LB1 TaxID=1410327 RepID=UPI000644B9CF
CSGLIVVVVTLVLFVVFVEITRDRDRYNMAFGKKSGKYKKVVKGIFPAQPGGEMQLQNTSKLVYFCEMNPELLPKVGQYIKLKAEKSLSKKRIDIVKTCVIIIRELIIGCRKNMVFFSSDATKLMELLLQQETHPDLQIEATETFIRFSQVQDDASQFPEVEKFIKYFITMCRNNTQDDMLRRRIRGEGMRGMSAYISILDLVDELDTFITKHREILSTILDNMQYRDQVPTPYVTNVKSLAVECLRNLSRRVDNITVTSLVQTILNYLDTQQLWIDGAGNNFPRECMLAVAKSVKSQHFIIMLTSFLRHLEISHPPPITKAIVHTAVSIVEDAPPGAINMVVSHLLKVLVQTNELSNRKPPPADLDELLGLSSAIVDAIGVVAKNYRLTHDKIETMNNIMNHLRSSIRTGAAADRYSLIQLNLTQCILQVSQTLTDVRPHTVLNDLTQKLLDLSDVASPEVRVYIQRILHTILLPNKSYDQMITSQGLGGEEDGVEEYMQENASFIRDSLLKGFGETNNQPNNYIAMFKTLVILLYRGKNKEIQNAIPMIFRIQKKQRILPFRLSRSVHLVIASYLLMVARLYNKPELDAYVQSVQKIRRDKDQNCRYLTFTNSALTNKSQQKINYREREKNKPSECELIDQDRVADFICSIATLKEVNNLRTQLTKKYNTITRRDLELPTDEVHHSPPVNTIPLFESSNDMPHVDLDDHFKKLTYDSFKQYTKFNTDVDGGSQHSASSQRHSISNTILLAKDLTFKHVITNCQESSIKIQTESELLMRLVLQSAQSLMEQDNGKDELSSTCTLKMNIQNVLEKV